MKECLLQEVIPTRTIWASEGQVSGQLDLNHREKKFSLLLPPVQMDEIRGSFPQRAKTQGRGTGKRSRPNKYVNQMKRVPKGTGGHTPPTTGESHRRFEIVMHSNEHSHRWSLRKVSVVRWSDGPQKAGSHWKGVPLRDRECSVWLFQHWVSPSTCKTKAKAKSAVHIKQMRKPQL